MQLLTIVVAAFFVVQANAQHLYMRKINTDKGVQAHDVYSVFQDSRQYLWFGTDAGVWRYDGKEYVSYTTANGLPDNVVFSFKEDRHQRIWLRMYSNKLAYIHNDEVTILPCSDKLAALKSNLIITSLEIGAGDTIYLSHLNSDEIVKIAPPYRAQDLHTIILQYKGTHFIYETPSGELLAGKATRVQDHNSHIITVFRQNKTIDVLVNGISIQVPRIMVARQQDGSYLLGMGRTLFSYKNQQLKELLHCGNDILHANYDRHHHLWVSTNDRGLDLFRNTDTTLSHPENYLAGVMPNSILQDNEGSYWITTLKNGIYYVPYNDVNLMNSGNGLGENISFSYYNAISHDLYCFGQGTLYVVRNQKTRKKVNINFPVSFVNEVNMVVELGQNKLLCLGRSTFILDKKTFATIPVNTSGNNRERLANTRSTYGYRKGDSVLVTQQNGLALLDQKNLCTSVIENFSGRINLVKPYGKQALLVGTEDGLVKYNTQTKQKIPLSFLPAHTSVKGVEYSAYQKGFLVVMKNGTIYLTDSLLTTIRKRLNRAEGHAVRRAYFDDHENLWLASSNGIYQVDKNLHIRNINQERGLPANLLNAITLHNDTAYVSSESGLIVFPARKSFFNTSPPVLYYKGTSVNGLFRGNDINYTLKHHENFIKITYQALNYRINSDVECRYFLHGIDYHWQTTRNNTIEYTTLPPGNYDFEMYTINNDGVKSQNTIHLHFTILQPFWNTWWFLFLGIFILSALIALIFVLRIRQIKKREREKNELTRKIAETEMQALRSQMNPHFIFNSINSIQHLVLINEPLTANYYLTKFSKLMRNVLEQSRMELVSLEEELENIRLYLVIESLRFEDKFRHHIELAPDILPDTIFVPPMIIQPFIENAIWHGLLLKKGEKELRIHIFTVDDYLHIEIDDNGIGREEARNYATTKLKKESLGMKITMERLHLLEKNQNIKTYIRIDDKYAAGKIPAGTKATIQLPIIKKSL